MTVSNTNIIIDPSDLGVIYNKLSPDKRREISNSIGESILKQKDKPTHKKWNDIWSIVKEKKQLEPLWLTDNNKHIYRWNNDFIETKDHQLERKYICELRERVLKPYINDISSIVEFGCGSGHNLIGLQKKFSNIEIYGSDFCDSALDILELYNVNNFKFDMYNDKIPENILDKIEETAILTVGAMEQLGENYCHFRDVLLKSNAKYKIHIEPMIELYDKYSEFDQLAIKYHKARHYLGKYLTDIRNSNVEILQCVRTGFGNMFNEGYMVLVWN